MPANMQNVPLKCAKSCEGFEEAALLLCIQSCLSGTEDSSPPISQGPLPTVSQVFPDTSLQSTSESWPMVSQNISSTTFQSTLDAFSSTSAITQSSQSPQSAKVLPLGPLINKITGITAGSTATLVILVILVLCGFILHWRRRKRYSRELIPTIDPFPYSNRTGSLLTSSGNQISEGRVESTGTVFVRRNKEHRIIQNVSGEVNPDIEQQESLVSRTQESENIAQESVAGNRQEINRFALTLDVNLGNLFENWDFRNYFVGPAQNIRRHSLEGTNINPPSYRQSDERSDFYSGFTGTGNGN